MYEKAPNETIWLGGVLRLRRVLIWGQWPTYSIGENSSPKPSRPGAMEKLCVILTFLLGRFT
jgi:hypothetical protein